MIIDSHEFVFLHIPKTGGKSIRSHLRCTFPDFKISEPLLSLYQDDGHMPLSEIFERHPKSKKYFKFAFVRNPWDRFVSAYCYYLNFKCNYQEFFLSEYLNSCSFECFLKELLYKKKILGYKLTNFSAFSLQTCWFENVENLDYIGRYDNLEKDFEYVCSQIGINYTELAHINQTKHLPYKTFYTEETKEIVSEFYKKDIEMLGFSF